MSESQSYAKLGPELAQRVETVLNTWLPKTELSPSNLHQAMRYSSLNAGKRIRPLLVYATGLCTGQDLTELDGPAAAIELIHVYSLIHDDLPCMDDDELRRGKPTCHIVYGDAQQHWPVMLSRHSHLKSLLPTRKCSPTMRCASPYEKHCGGSRFARYGWRPGH